MEILWGVGLDPEAIWRMSEPELLHFIEEVLLPTRERDIRFFAPSFINYNVARFRSSLSTFPSISITGNFCSLGCKHCQGKILANMIQANTPTKLIEVCKSLKERGCVGILISGGCLPDGSVPLDKFAEAIAKIKKSLGLTIVVHTGITDSQTAKRLKDAGVDAALIDVIGSNETIKEVYKLNVTVEDYDASLRVLNESGIPLVPHVLVGLHYGKLRGELHALRMISKYDPAAVIIIAFIPIKGTAMETATPPTPEAILRVLIATRLLMPSTPFVLGCMRPKGEHRVKTDLLAVKAGVNAIAFPSKEAIHLAEVMGLKIAFSPLCCSQIFE